jgi:hypothetical protein
VFESRLAICEAKCLLRSSLYLAIRRSEMVLEPEPEPGGGCPGGNWSRLFSRLILR